MNSKTYASRSGSALAALLFAAVPLAGQDYLECNTGSALRFDGVDDAVVVPWSPSLPTEVFTVSAWIRAEGPFPHHGVLVSRGEDDSSDNVSWTLRVSMDGTLAVVLEDDTDFNQSYGVNTQVADGVWHHVAATRDVDGTLAMYVDGVVQGSFTDTVVPSANNQQDLTIGCTHGNLGFHPPAPKTEFFQGRIDEVELWRVALSPAEVFEVYMQGTEVAPVWQVADFRFEEELGQVALDSSPEGNHGVLGIDLLEVGDGADPDWYLRPVCPLSATVGTIGISTGGTHELYVDAGPERAGDVYWILGSATGTSPGIAGAFPLPLNYDLYFEFLFANPNTLVQGSLGFLDGNGRAQASLFVGAGEYTETLVGIELHHAFVVFDSFPDQPAFVSNPLPLRFVD